MAMPTKNNKLMNAVELISEQCRSKLVMSGLGKVEMSAF